ncbi:hypothetical protein MBLNU459_g2594t1 [Dothideomycetes sp. NU459]
MMKTGIFALSALSLLNVAAAQPAHRRHQHLHEKRDVVTIVDYVTAAQPDVVVYVDEEGNALSTVSSGQAATSVASSAVATTAASSPAEATSVYVAPTTTAAATSAAATSATSSAAASSSSSASGPSGYGLSYSPYNADGTCKTQDQVNSDFESISGYSFIRSYGTDCNQVETILTAASAKGMKLFAGIFDITQVSSSVATIISAANGDWSNIHTVSIGNEGVNDGSYTVDAVVSAIGTAKSLLSAAGYTGSVVTVDTFVAMIANPELCDASDYAAANAHPFFDGGVEAANAGPWVLEQMQRVSNACNGKNTWITETGWPTQGQTNNKAVPSSENQKAAISSIQSSLASNVVLFTAFNDMWKTNTAYTYGAEQYWGIYN